MHVDELLERCEDAVPGGIFLGHGGHSRAGGFRVAAERFDLAKEMLEREAFGTLHLEHIGAELRVDAEVRLAQMTLDAARKVRSLAPFGMEFEEPLFLCRDLTLQRVTPLSGGKHARLSVQQGTSRMEAVNFRTDPALFTLPTGSSIDAVFHLQTRRVERRHQDSTVHTGLAARLTAWYARCRTPRRIEKGAR